MESWAEEKEQVQKKRVTSWEYGVGKHINAGLYPPAKFWSTLWDMGSGLLEMYRGSCDSWFVKDQIDGI